MCGFVFVALAVAGNALQGATPAVHGEGSAMARFYGDRPLAISIGMSLSLVSLFFLAWFLGGLRRNARAG